MKKMKNRNKVILSLISIIVVLILLAIGVKEETIKDIFNINNVEEQNVIASDTQNELDETQTKKNFIAEDKLVVDYIDVGQADSILLRNKDKTMLIDAGTNEQGKNVVSFLKEEGISKIDYLIGTHPHEDHIGGLDDVINNFEIGKIYMPKRETTTKTFKDVLSAIKNKNLTITQPKKGEIIDLGQAKCEFMTEPIIDDDNINLSSLILRVEFGNNSFLFMGDAEKQNEKTITWPKTDVLKVGHHGSDTSSSKEFLEQVNPKYSIIMVGEGNTYKLPKQPIIDRIEKIGSKIYRTDKNGNIKIISDGNNLEIKTEKE
ncbi:MAG: ComEC/Rec2 family competence protein [Clostridia bacterium]